MSSIASTVEQKSRPTHAQQWWAENNFTDLSEVLASLFPNATIRCKKDGLGLPTSLAVNVSELNSSQLGRLENNTLFTKPQIEVKVKRSGAGLVVIYFWDNSTTV